MTSAPPATRHLIPLGALAGTLALTFLALSYADTLVVSVRADRERFADLPVLVAAMNQDWQTIAAPPVIRSGGAAG